MINSVYAEPQEREVQDRGVENQSLRLGTRLPKCVPITTGWHAGSWQHQDSKEEQGMTFSDERDSVRESSPEIGLCEAGNTQSELERRKGTDDHSGVHRCVRDGCRGGQTHDTAAGETLSKKRTCARRVS